MLQYMLTINTKCRLTSIALSNIRQLHLQYLKLLFNDNHCVPFAKIIYVKSLPVLRRLIIHFTLGSAACRHFP